MTDRGDHTTAIASERYRGLLHLRGVGLPVPSWRVLRAPDDLDVSAIDPTEFGWTIRTCRSDGYAETGGYYLNNATPEQVRRALGERLVKYGPDEFYLLYPSWNFRLSFNVVVFEDKFDVEAAFGSQKGITMGSETPALSLRSYDRRLERYDVLAGVLRDDVRRPLLQIMRYLGRIDERSYYVEVAVTATGAVIFYEMMRIPRMGLGKRRPWTS